MVIITSQADANRRCERVGWVTVHHKADAMGLPAYIEDARNYKARHLAAVLHEFGMVADDVPYLKSEGWAASSSLATGRILNTWIANGMRGAKPHRINPPGSDETVALVEVELRRLEDTE